MILMVPSAIAGSAVQVNVMVNGQFASHIPGAMSWLYYAFRLVQLPIGIFGVAIATVTLPAVARQHALDDLKAFGKTVEEALRFGFYLTLPASVGLAVDRATGHPAHLRARHLHRGQHGANRAGVAGLHHRPRRLFGHQDSRALLLCHAAAALRAAGRRGLLEFLLPFRDERRPLHARRGSASSASR